MSLIKIQHKFLKHEIHPNTEILIIGTFNPCHECNKDNDFFYSSPNNRNRLWKLLPFAFGESDLRHATVEEKLTFSRNKHIDFIDIIQEVEVDEEEACNRNDAYIDKRVTQWRDVDFELKKLPSLKRACFTRKTFDKHVQRIGEKVERLQKSIGKPFHLMHTPAWFPPKDEPKLWTRFLLGGLDNESGGDGYS
jgi:G:T/U-mismatch repair DNA glycosylase